MRERLKINILASYQISHINGRELALIIKALMKLPCGEGQELAEEMKRLRSQTQESIYTQSKDASIKDKQ